MAHTALVGNEQLSQFSDCPPSLLAEPKTQAEDLCLLVSQLQDPNLALRASPPKRLSLVKILNLDVETSRRRPDMMFHRQLGGHRVPRRDLRQQVHMLEQGFFQTGPAHHG
jgi:hypothetical protein